MVEAFLLKALVGEVFKPIFIHLYMGASQSTRDIPDYVYVHFNIQPDDTLKLNLFVCNTTNRYKLREYIREKEMHERNDDSLPPPLDSREKKDIYLHLHADTLETPQVSFHVTKTLEELIAEREALLKEVHPAFS